MPDQWHSQPPPTSLGQECLGLTCHLHFWQNERDLIRATAVTRGWNGQPNESAHKVNSGEENSPAAPAGDSNSQPLDHESGAVPITSYPGSLETTLPSVQLGVC